MAFISFYNADDRDQQRFSELLQNTGHTCEFIAGDLSLEHSNPNAEVISIFIRDKVTPSVLAHMPNLKLIATRSTGFDHIDMQAAKERGIAVVNVPSYGEATVAEYTFALLLALSRKLPQIRGAIGEGAVDYGVLRGFDLDGKTLGLIGTGKIGRHVAKIAKGFGMQVMAFDAHPDEAKAREIGFGYTSLDELVEQSDVISLHVPATSQTQHIVDSRLLAKVKSSAVLLNTARGELVDTRALVAALGAGQLAGAALDVLEHEALLQASETQHATHEIAQAVIDIATLKGMRNVIVTPHNAFNTYEAVDRIRQATVQNIIDFYKGDTPNKVEV